MSKFRRGTKLPITDRLRLIKRTSSRAIQEIKSASSVDSLLEKHSVNGSCLQCKKKGLVIKNVNLCVNCSLKGKKWEKRFRKKANEGTCSQCGIRGLVDKQHNECFSCYIANKRGGLDK